MLRAGRALAAFEGARQVTAVMITRLAPMALRHRLRRDPMDEAGSGARIARALAELDTGAEVPRFSMGASA